MQYRILLFTPILYFFTIQTDLFAQDSLYIKVHFLYGSKPAKQYKDAESKWFGGIHGGHVGVEADSDHIVNFLPAGGFHVFAHDNDRHSTFTAHTYHSFYSMFGGHHDSVKKMTILIPVTIQQKVRFDSIAQQYINETPYDYAFIGMRCGAAAYDLLASIGILEQHREMPTAFRIFYPKKLRIHLLAMAEENQWTVLRSEGSHKRKWERD